MLSVLLDEASLPTLADLGVITAVWRGVMGGVRGTGVDARCVR
ncbi:hypothetical protein [Streptacidiphilus sp. EB129]